MILSIFLITLFLTPALKNIVTVSLDWRGIMVFAALISATDPVAVLSIFESVEAPRRLAMLLDGESLLNDGTAIVFFILSLSLFSDQPISAGGIIFEFIEKVGIGIILGAGIGLAAAQVFRIINDPTVEIALTLIIAYGSFIIAESLDFSGIIATVSAGIVTGNYATRVGMLPSTRLSVESFWKYVAFAINSIIFLLIGLEVNFIGLVQSWKVILIAFITVSLARALVVTGITAIVRKSRECIPWKWSAVISWGGFRGALPMVLVLTLPGDLPFRNLLIHTTFGVVIISILLQGFTILPFMKWLKIVKKQTESSDYDFARGKLQAFNAAVRELDEISDLHFINPGIIDDLKKEYEKRIEDNRETIKKSGKEEDIKISEKKWILRHVFHSEKINVNKAYYSGVISEPVRNKLINEIDRRLLALDTEDEEGNI